MASPTRMISREASSSRLIVPMIRNWVSFARVRRAPSSAAAQSCSLPPKSTAYGRRVEGGSPTTRTTSAVSPVRALSSQIGQPPPRPDVSGGIQDDQVGVVLGGQTGDIARHVTGTEGGAASRDRNRSQCRRGSRSRGRQVRWLAMGIQDGRKEKFSA